MDKYIDYKNLKRDCLINLLECYEQSIQHQRKEGLFSRFKKLKPIPTINQYLNSDVALTEEEYKESQIDVNETVIKIINEFEHLLEKYNIDIPDKYRQGDEDEAHIYGDEYYILENNIKQIILENL